MRLLGDTMWGPTMISRLTVWSTLFLPTVLGFLGGVLSGIILQRLKEWDDSENIAFLA
jgi:hypothetical protein